MGFETISTRHLVKGEDLNHHGTLYAGRGTEWMVETGFITASTAVGNSRIVCMRINSLLFRKPVPKGQLVTYDGTIVFAGRTSLTVYVKVTNGTTREFVVDGFFTYVYVDEQGKPIPHNITVTPSGEAEQKLYEEARSQVIESKKAVGSNP